MTSTRRYFDRRARAFDRRYARPGIARPLRRGPERGRDLAVSVVRRHAAPDVLDVGCGPGRVAEAVLEAGATGYVGIDVSPEMLAIARLRLAPYEHVELLEGDFLDLRFERTFDVVLALGLFDYLAQPVRAAAWLRDRCRSSLVVSFTRWDWLKAPLRHLHYQLGHGLSIFDYSEEAAEQLLIGAGFSSVRFHHQGRRGFLVHAWTPRGPG
jgi:SAM-dependent methyltransferase